jgi:hypothetical protein
MATILASPSEERTGQSDTQPSTRTARRSRLPAAEESGLGTRFFLPKPGTNGKALELGRELSSEGEARVEALKLGVTYYSVQEWRPVADFAGKNPELKREAVTRKEPG